MRAIGVQVFEHQNRQRRAFVHHRHRNAGCGIFGTDVFLHISNKPKSLFGKRPNNLLGGTVVAKRSAGCIDPRVQTGIADDPTVPDVLDQLVLRDDLASAFNQDHQKIQYLRLQGNWRAVA